MRGGNHAITWRFGTFHVFNNSHRQVLSRLDDNLLMMMMITMLILLSSSPILSSYNVQQFILLLPFSLSSHHTMLILPFSYSRLFSYSLIIQCTLFLFSSSPIVSLYLCIIHDTLYILHYTVIYTVISTIQ